MVSFVVHPIGGKKQWRISLITLLVGENMPTKKEEKGSTQPTMIIAPMTMNYFNNHPLLSIPLGPTNIC